MAGQSKVVYGRSHCFTHFERPITHNSISRQLMSEMVQNTHLGVQWITSKTLHALHPTQSV